ncbi:hypothetical protein, partial [uncultured Bradyrhizobium sp.]|uniref:hypothetical protein n=1 Tax=uncultured Bradyrhizobium sp. TaxID=199684 RepID=UPI0035CAC83B
EEGGTFTGKPRAHGAARSRKLALFEAVNRKSGSLDPYPLSLPRRRWRIYAALENWNRLIIKG